MSLATSGEDLTWVDGVVVAERRAMSKDCRDDMLTPYAFSRLTVNALYSGVCVLASPTTGVKVFTE